MATEAQTHPDRVSDALYGQAVAMLAAALEERVALRAALAHLIDEAVEVAADDTPLLLAVQEARAALTEATS